MSDDVRFLPPGLIAVAIVVAAAGGVLLCAWTPLLGVPQGGSLSLAGFPAYEWAGFHWGPWMLLLKGFVGAWFVWHAVLILRADRAALGRLVPSLAVVGLLGPLLLSASSARIEPFFVALLRVTVFSLAAGLLYYLTRPSVVEAIGAGGVVGTRRYRYCPICGAKDFLPSQDRCPSCDDTLLDRFDTASGLVFGQRAAGLPTVEALARRRPLITFGLLSGFTGLTLVAAALHPVFEPLRVGVVALGLSFGGAALACYARLDAPPAGGPPHDGP